MPLTPAGSLPLSAPVAPPIAVARGLSKIYGRGSTEVRALDGVDVTLARGHLTAIMGPSGSGKSTLMHCLAGLDRPTAGEVLIDGQPISDMSERQLTRLRRTRLGFVFQAFNLIPTLTARENITLPLDIARTKVDEDWFREVIEAVGLSDRLGHRPSELSGGQQQRVACARALITRPAVVFADEPTGNLDSVASGEVLGFLRGSVDRLGQSVVMVTHEPSAAVYADRVLFLADGNLVGEITHPTTDAVIDALRDPAHRTRPVNGETARHARSAGTSPASPDVAVRPGAPERPSFARPEWAGVFARLGRSDVLSDPDPAEVATGPDHSEVTTGPDHSEATTGPDHSEEPRD